MLMYPAYSEVKWTTPFAGYRHSEGAEEKDSCWAWHSVHVKGERRELPLKGHKGGRRVTRLHDQLQRPPPVVSRNGCRTTNRASTFVRMRAQATGITKRGDSSHIQR